jgi:energy-coupling factor transporter ATP-binding protein EcfA2
MNLVSENCSRAVVFNKGKIALSGTPKEIFSDAKKVAELGLDLPVTAKLTNDLKDKGIIIDSDLTTDDFIQKYLQAVKGNGGAE